MQLETLNSKLLVKLLTGIIYYDDPLWQELINNKSAIAEYFLPLNLSLSLHESDGFAYLKQEEDGDENTPRVVKRHPLSFEVSLLLVILREEFENFDVSGSDETEFYLTKTEISEFIEVYFREKRDEVRLLKELERYINAVVKLGFLKVVNSSSDTVYKVMPIIKAKVDPAFMEEFKRRLHEYVTSI